MNMFWQNKIKAFLHDPPDKALILFHKSHEKKAADIWENVGLREDAERLRIKGLRAYPKIHEADIIASVMQRLNIPQEFRMDKKSDPHIGFRGCRKCLFWPEFRHTLSGVVEKFEYIDEFTRNYGYENALSEFGFVSSSVKKFVDNRDWKKTYFLLWRFLPDVVYPLGYMLPADTRIPDHNIWDHLDVTSAIYSCLEGGGLCLLAVKIPAVQGFISHSRKLSDLWASSHIYSTIIFEGIRVISEKLGPDAVIYPQLRGNPLVDSVEFDGDCDEFTLLEEARKFGLIKEDIANKLHIANFPNIFLSFVPRSIAEKISEDVEKAIRKKWKGIGDTARELLEDDVIKIDEMLWNTQIENAIEPVSVWLDFFNLDKFDKVKSELPGDLREMQEKWLEFVEEAERRNHGHFYALTYRILGIMLAQKSRLWGAWEEKPVTGKKCLMCGRRNAVLLRDESGNYKAWRDQNWQETDIKLRYKLRYILKEGERLCAVCLVKRLYRQIFSKMFRGAALPPYESVAEVAGRDFIEKIDETIYKKLKEKDIELIYESEWDSKDEVKMRYVRELGGKDGEIYKQLKELWEIHGKPNKYYAILMMDGDKVGKMLSGETLPDFGEFLHPAFKNKILKWKEGEVL